MSEKTSVENVDKSQKPKSDDNILGTAPVKTLLKKFAIPSVAAMLISSLYNIVDQIFIGRVVQEVGNAATNIAFPITTICIAISVLCGVGGASFFSIELGRGHKNQAENSIGTALITALGMSCVYTILAMIFTEEMLVLFGGNGETLDFAMRYTSVLLYGVPFLVLTNVMSNFARADGSPKFSMICMVIGAVINIILDAILVPMGGVERGMQNAALATVISQVISFAIAISYIGKFKTVDFSLRKFRFSIKTAFKICSLGMSNCVNQIAICAVQIVMNNQLTKYGLIEFGPEMVKIPQAAFGVVMKVNSLLISFFVGMAQGSQPIVGYNYGAGKLQRSKECFKLSAIICFGVALVGFLCFQFFPELIISVFGSSEGAYIDFAKKTMRIFLSMIMLNGVQLTISNYFSAIGKPIKGVILSMTRQILFIIPLMIVLPLFLGLDGVLYSAPITDFAAFILAFVLIIFEFRNSAYSKTE